MRVKILASAPEKTQDQFLTTFLVDDRVAIDAGCLGSYREPHDQAQISNVFITHSHADHLASLPIFVENAYEEKPQSVIIHGNAHVLESIRSDVFNDRIWPDFIRLSPPKKPFLELREVHPETPVSAGHLTVTPVPVDHVVPTFGYIVDDGTSAVAFSSDTGPTARIWEVAGGIGHLKAVFMEATFPDRMSGLAEVSAHLTPRTFGREVEKIPPGADVFAIHIKPRFREEIIRQLTALDIPRVRIGEIGREYGF